MHVERDRDRVEQRLRDDLAVRCDDERAGAERPRFVDERPQTFGGEDTQSAHAGGTLGGRCDEPVAASGGAIRLRDDADDVVTFRNRVEDRDRERAGPEDEELQRAPAATASASATSSSVTAGRMFFAVSM
ncbi:hypothetical protein WPS_11550 [Vulcanimicrobium alpinum]|uniref:Uncharacterized protein n=1 Tax=Vulcanimicrobium alpinum TaxID=3016050 RepID=A0AAN2C926_UNVUL|nr:hypothetical protein WPS_11550 [Vulcanimicrobium alpinum]